jgi:hypothetical protein
LEAFRREEFLVDDIRREELYESGSDELRNVSYSAVSSGTSGREESVLISTNPVGLAGSDKSMKKGGDRLATSNEAPLLCVSMFVKTDEEWGEGESMIATCTCWRQYFHRGRRRDIRYGRGKEEFGDASEEDTMSEEESLTDSAVESMT